MTIYLLLFIVTIIAIAIVVRKRKDLLFFVIASGLAIVIAFLVLLKNAIKYTM
jgi:hypothetical protein